jgi:hypothetical protein
MENDPKDLSRREFSQKVLGCALCAAITLTLGPKLAAAKEKMSKADVKYQNSPHGSERCGKCSMFSPPSSCRVVEGAINPNGWCTNFSA